MNGLKKIDQSALASSQATIVLCNLLAFILDWPWLAALVTAAMLLGTLLGRPGFGFVYHLVLKPLRLVRPQIVLDNPEPHRFAQGFGGTVMLAASLLLYLGQPVPGWALVWLVAALAALNAFGGFCVGCFLYYRLGRLGLPGFGKQPPQGIFPGRRSKELVNDGS